MAFTPDSSRLLSGANGRVNVWDVRKGQRLHSQSTFSTGYIQSLAVSSDGKLFAAAGSPAGELQVFHMPRK
jgi:WD40 repeat protein